MGTIRARTQQEMDARREEILRAAEALFLREDYHSITLGMIAERTSLSRPSVYHYFSTKEELFLELSKQGYLDWKEDLESLFSESLSREAFCRRLTESLFARPLMLKLMNLHSAALEQTLPYETMFQFKKEVQPFFSTFGELLRRQFPVASERARERFRIQFMLYGYCLYPLCCIPEDQRRAMQELNTFGEIPAPETLCYEALLLLSAELEPGHKGESA